MSHVPLHPASLGRWGANVHGHLHSNFVKDPVWPDKPDQRYICVSVEHTDYYPLHEYCALGKLSPSLSVQVLLHNARYKSTR